MKGAECSSKATESWRFEDLSDPIDLGISWLCRSLTMAVKKIIDMIPKNTKAFLVLDSCCRWTFWCFPSSSGLCGVVLLKLGVDDFRSIGPDVGVDMMITAQVAMSSWPCLLLLWEHKYCSHCRLAYNQFANCLQWTCRSHLDPDLPLASHSTETRSQILPKYLVPGTWMRINLLTTSLTTNRLHIYVVLTAPERSFHEKLYNNSYCLPIVTCFH